MLPSAGDNPPNFAFAGSCILSEYFPSNCYCIHTVNVNTLISKQSLPERYRADQSTYENSRKPKLDYELVATLSEVKCASVMSITLHRVLE